MIEVDSELVSQTRSLAWDASISLFVPFVSFVVQFCFPSSIRGAFPPHDPITLRAAASTASTVKPNFFMASAAGALVP